MSFAVLDHDSLVAAMQHVWNQVAPPAMFTAAGNIALRNSEDFSTVLSNIRWNLTVSDAIEQGFETSDTNQGFGFSGTSSIKPNKVEGSNGRPTQFDNEFNYFVEDWGKGDDVYAPAGFSPIRAENILYADTLPPFDVCLTFGNEYGQACFKKIFDCDIANDSSGVSVDTTVMERQLTYIARRLSPLIRGVYSRENSGMMKGISPVSS